MTGHDVIDLAKKFEDYGSEAIIYTDIGRDGVLTGVNSDATVEVARHADVALVSGGGGPRASCPCRSWRAGASLPSKTSKRFARSSRKASRVRLRGARFTRAHST